MELEYKPGFSVSELGGSGQETEYPGCNSVNVTTVLSHSALDFSTD